MGQPSVLKFHSTLKQKIGSFNCEAIASQLKLDEYGTFLRRAGCLDKIAVLYYLPSMKLQTVESLLKEKNEPKFRFTQVKRAFYKELALNWEALTVFPKALRDSCSGLIPWDALTIEKETRDPHDGTEKLLCVCHDGAKIETVLMRHHRDRNTVCVSSQVGCPMACAFCATGAQGFKRNLTRDEIAEQVILFARRLAVEGARVTNVVVMGMGEPMHNYDAVIDALRLLNDADGFGLGARHMSVSTCGVVPGILRLADEDLQINLAISLHAAMNEVRDSIMPVNRTYPLSELMRAVHTYMQKTNRRVMFEYVLLDGVNDSIEHARALAALLGDDYRLVHVNLLTYHATKGFAASDRRTADAFLTELHHLGVPATYRKNFGEEIDAACGQLAA